MLLVERLVCGLGLAALTAYVLAVQVQLRGYAGLFTLLTTSFWGPLAQSAGIFLQLARDRRRRNEPAILAEDDGQKLPGAAMPVYQLGCVLALFNAAFAVAEVAFWRSSALGAVGIVPLICFLVDALVFGAVLQFRFGYIWMSVVVLAEEVLTHFVRLATRGVGGEVWGIVVAIAVGAALELLLAGVPVTLLVRVVPRYFGSNQGRAAAVVGDTV